MPKFDFRKLIREKRKELNLSQFDVAQKAGVSVTTYGRIERGEVQLKLDEILNILEVLGYDLTEVIGLEEFKGPDPRQLTVSDCIEKLDYYLEELKKLHGGE